MFVIKNKTIFLWISVAVVAVSLTLLGKFGLNLGIDFVGGALAEVSYTEEMPEMEELDEALEAAGFENVTLQPTGEQGLFVKTKNLTEEERVALFDTLSGGQTYAMEEVQFTSIGPSVGKELQNKALIALILVSIAIVLFVAYIFRGVSKPVKSWKYGIIAVIALVHDVVLTIGVFVLIGYFTGAQVDTLFVVALLTVLGLSVNDTIVVFDRIRENLLEDTKKSFDKVVAKSLGETYTRSINTSVSTIIVLLTLFFIGPESTKFFALTLTFGMFFGTYSSIFLASPLLVKFYEWQKK